jgi:uncharacterized SAM-binding protein YcdF (DUF218 family)
VQAADLYNDGRAERMIIVEESMGGHERLEQRGVKILSNTTQARNAAVALGVPADSITILPGDAESTMMEAQAVKEYLMNDVRTDTVIIVTKATHSRRATMIFKAALKQTGRKMCVICSPSEYMPFDIKHWWRDKEGIQAVLSEYVKMGSFLFVEQWGLKDKRQK